MITKSTKSSRTSKTAADAAKPIVRAKKVCQFCTNKTEPTYTDSATLRKSMSDRSKIIGHQRSGVCSKHQRRLSLAIKHARHLGLLPFTTQL